MVLILFFKISVDEKELTVDEVSRKYDFNV
jgi:hypothetical protein